MRALPRLRFYAPIMGLFLFLSVVAGCNSKTAGPAPIVNGSAQSQQKNPYANRGGYPQSYQSYGMKRSPLDNIPGLGPLLAQTEGLPVNADVAFWCFIAGLLLGAFFSQRFKPYRKWIIAGILAIVSIWILVRGGPLAYIGWFVLGFILAWMALRVFLAYKKSTLFGSAEWADRGHIVGNNLNGDTGLWLGTFKDARGTIPLHYTGDRHLLTIAPTRAGKGVAAIIPNLLKYEGSALVIDPKGENAMVTQRRRREMGQAVHIVDPWGITGLESKRFNPIVWLDPADEDIGENALMLADSLIVRSGKGESSFWEEEAMALLWGLILYVALDTRPDADRSLAGVRDLIILPEEKFTEFLKEMYQHKNEIVSSTAARTISKEPKVKSSVIATLQAHTHFLDSPRMRHTLRGSDFKFEDLKTTKMTVYLVLPADRLGTFNRWLRLLIQQAITVNARNIEQKPDKPILFMLDEMAALGKLQKVEEAYGLMAGFGMQLWGIAQDASQLKRIYGDGWETFVANAGVLQYFGSRDERTSSYFSKLCGVGTETKTSSSITRSGQGASTTTSSDLMQRQLAFPDELMRVDAKKELLLIENFNPIIAQKLAWFSDPRLMNLGDSLTKKKVRANL